MRLILRVHLAEVVVGDVGRFLELDCIYSFASESAKILNLASTESSWTGLLLS